MARTETESLVVALEARINDFEKKFERANRTAKRSYAEITAGSSRAGSMISKNMADAATRVNASLASFGKGFVGGFVAGAVAEFTGAIKGAVSSVANLKAEAQQAGLGVEPFQKLKAAALDAKVGTDALVDGLKEMQLRIDEFVSTGSGSAAESLQRLGYDADTLKVKLKDPSQLFLELIGRIQLLDQAARIRVADELFGGTAGEQFVRLVDLGADKVERIGNEAEAAGRVIDTALVERAAELDRRFNAVADTIRTNIVSAVVAASDSMQPLIRQNEELARSFQDLMNNPSGGNFGRFMLGSWGGYGPVPAADPAEMRRESARAAALSGLGRTPAPAPVDQSNLPPVPERKPNLLDYDPNGSARGTSSKSVDLQRKSVEQLIGALEEELRLVNATDAERAVSNNLRAAGATATETERQRIEALTTAYYSQSEAIEKARQAQEYFADAAYSAIDGLLVQGDSLQDVFANLAKSIAQAALQAALLGQGPLAGILGLGGKGGGIGGIIGALLGGGFAAGGYTGAGGRNQPAGVVHRGEYVISKPAVDRIGVGRLDALHSSLKGYAMGGYVGAPQIAAPSRGGGAAPAMNVTVHVDARGSTSAKELEQQIQASAVATYRQVMKDVPRALPKWQTDYATYRG